MRRLFDDILRGFGRSIGWKLGALLLVVVLGFLGMGEARAHDQSAIRCVQPPSGQQAVCDQGQAHAEANSQAVANAHGRAAYAPDMDAGCFISIIQPVSHNAASKSYTTNYRMTCPQYNNYTTTIGGHTFHYGAACSARADLVGLSVANFQNAGKVCSFGCEYDQTTPNSDTTIKDLSTGNEVRFGTLLGGKANGNTCTNPDGKDERRPENEPPQCLTVGQDSNGPIQHCPKPDGGSCIVTGKGTKFCQPPPPGTQGPKVDTGREAGMSQSADGSTPPQPPANRPGENFQQASSSTVTNNITNNTSNTTSYTNTGTPNVNGSPVPGDGSGPSGTGQQEGGSGTGTGTGGTGTGEGADMGPTNALLDGIKGALEGDDGASGGFGAQVDGIGTGDETPPDDDTSDPFDGMKETRNSSWFLDQLDDAGFLGGGSCPSDQSVSVGGGSFQLSLAPLCQLLSAISGLVMAVAYIIAFRIMAT